MITERLYFADPYLTSFSARVVARAERDGRPAVALDQSAFYPEGGGQPPDAGTLDDVPVLDVQADDGLVWHTLARPLDAEIVQGRVDWARRFDHMQQHHGQHLLSAAFEHLHGLRTISFHLGAASATIDLAGGALAAEQAFAAEELANQVIWEDRPVLARFVSAEELARLPLRKPPAVDGPVRVVSVPDFDHSACGGTHPRATGGVGLLHIRRWDRRGDAVRVEFLCGGRAVRDELARVDLGSRVRPGSRIAVGAGSRGVAGYALIVGAVVAELRRLGAEPFVFPAMGSHGGATAEGQLAVLAEWGITPERMGCPVRSSMEVVQVGATPSGIAVFCDAAAHASDGIVLVNRVKIHTDFHGPTESGLTKMMAIGLGKRQGAELIHARGVRGLREEIPRVAAVQLGRSPILCGVAIVEDGAHNVSHVQAVLAADIPREEPAILERSRRLMAALPVAACDLLIVDWIGKDISGGGMDGNIIGRMLIDGEPEPQAPQVGLLLARLEDALDAAVAALAGDQ